MQKELIKKQQQPSVFPHREQCGRFDMRMTKKEKTQRFRVWRRDGVVRYFSGVEAELSCRHTHTKTHTHRLHWLVFFEREPHVLLHLLQAVIVSVDQVKGQRASERATAPAWRHSEKPAQREVKHHFRQGVEHDIEELGIKTHWAPELLLSSVNCQSVQTFIINSAKTVLFCSTGGELRRNLWQWWSCSFLFCYPTAELTPTVRFEQDVFEDQWEKL